MVVDKVQNYLPRIDFFVKLVDVQGETENNEGDMN